ncbi:c-type cytochrome [Tunicatimonas pelagia]|uniref:c-type cytochrome n=1 Tax=Tunicatimonas pelagia TaxID=931531 RepID=UPI002666105C|nr:cytochrome c [Tunicatimonas pelagia]WKN41594.1 cytochrome c [Tunicatimonas pelagia]
MKLCVLVSICCFLSGCDGGKFQNSATQNLSRADKLHYEQYMIQGQQLYATHCSNCHQPDGTGLGQLIPPLFQSDYMLSDQSRTFCVIKYGLNQEIVVNGEVYNQPMPANEQLTNIEIAQIATYIYNSWGHEQGYIPVKKVAEEINKCQ